MAAGVGDAAGGGTCAAGAATVQRAIDAALVLPAASVCVTRSRCSPTGSPENVTGDEHAAAAASSSEQANVAPSSPVIWNVPSVIEDTAGASGAVVSTVKRASAGDGSARPARLTARTRKRCPPSASVAGV